MDLEPLVRPVVEASGLELVDVAFRRESGRRVLRVTVDREGGVDLDAIADTSGRISRRLDVEGFDPGPYDLEVSSPGVERPLRSVEDFARRIGEKVKVKTHEPVDGARTHVGTISSVGGSSVMLEIDEREREIPADAISSARTVFEWGQARSKP
ncbi:MAG TPA: ribosome maturation factor RimP [Actinomycetota bacterium]|nr:ribosome maturation factor RimP [Actinomycetota bacterium]